MRGHWDFTIITTLPTELQLFHYLAKIIPLFFSNYKSLNSMNKEFHSLEIESLKRCIALFDDGIKKTTSDIDRLEDQLHALKVCRQEFQEKLEKEELLESHFEQMDHYYAAEELAEEQDRLDDYNDYHHEDSPSENPEYIVASTSSRAQETYVFEANADGTRTGNSEYGGIAARYGHEKWTDKNLAVRTCFPDKYYTLVRSWEWMDDGYPGDTALYRREELPNVLTYWDGDESDRITY